MIFVDTGAFYARYVRRDMHFDLATRLWRELQGTPLLTTNHVIEESLTLLARRAGYEYAANLADRVFRSTTIEVVYTTREEELAALPLLKKFADQRIGFTDCISFAVMRRHGVKQAFTFDRHFADAGFQIIEIS